MDGSQHMVSYVEKAKLSPLFVQGASELWKPLLICFAAPLGMQ
jgi:hypothetical protein